MPEVQAIKAGEVAPDFALPDSKDTPRRLSELARGGYCLLVFYRGHW